MYLTVFFPFLQLLKIFVKEKLSSFVSFSEANKDYITSLGKAYQPSTCISNPCQYNVSVKGRHVYNLNSRSTGLDYDFCIHKMRQLTLTSLSVEAEQVPMSLLRQELDLAEGELEMFVLEGVQWGCCDI